VLDIVLIALLAGASVYLVMHLLAHKRERALAQAKAAEARFRSLTELSADWFWETDAEHRITWISGGPPVATFFGHSPAYGKRFWEIARVEVEPRALQAHLERLEEKLPFFDLEIARRDERGARQIHIISGQSHVGADGRFLGYRGVGRDITEQRRAEERLFGAKERLELALDGGNLAEWHFDVAADELYAGDGWVRFLGHDRSPPVTRGADLFALIHAEDRPKAKELLVRALKGEVPQFDVEFRIATKDGQWKWLHAKGRVVERGAGERAQRMSGTVADIDERKRVQSSLQETEQRYRALIELAPDGLVVSSGGSVEYANAAAARILRAGSPRRLLGMSVEEVFHPGPGATTFEDRRVRALDGAEITAEVTSVSFLERGRLLLQTVFRDVTEQRKAREKLAEREQRFRDVAEASGEYVWETDAEWRYTYLSERAEAVLGYERAELLGRNPREFMPPGEERAVDEWLARHAAGGAPFRGLVHCSITKSGALVWQAVSGVAVRDAAGALVGYRGTAADVTARKTAEARIEQLATRDALTGLANRVLLAERGAQAILAAARGRRQLALLCVDLDRFKLVNDALGHAAGDVLLRAVAERLQNLVREGTLARLGGDDFVLLQAINGPEEAAGLAQRVLAVLARPFTLDGATLAVGASIGVSLYPGDGRDIAELLQNADSALYHAKDSGRGTFRFFMPGLADRARQRLRLENELRGALARSELTLHWQPVIRGRNQLVGAEALVRWQHPERGLLQPEDFVPLAEECGLIRAVGEWTLERALSQAGAWQRKFPGRAWIALNVSAPELALGQGYVERVRDALQANGLDGASLELEVTERVLMSRLEEHIEVLRRIGELGVRFAIDDFGTGYSSLAYLRALPIDKLKIDRAFLRTIDTDAADEAIARTIAALARTLGLSVAAEGVETEAQLSRLLAAGCDEWQGHYFSAPLDATAFEAMLSSSALSERISRKSEA
jgi:diguanylate cyclase (GGDEF)-like protein/PAS domain S-box-containing protein